MKSQKTIKPSKIHLETVVLFSTTFKTSGPTARKCDCILWRPHILYSRIAKVILTAIMEDEKFFRIGWVTGIYPGVLYSGIVHSQCIFNSYRVDFLLIILIDSWIVLSGGRECFYFPKIADPHAPSLKFYRNIDRWKSLSEMLR